MDLLLNLSQVPYMNSWGVGELASSFITVRNRQGTLKVAASQSRVTKMLAISKLDTAIEVFDTEAEALQSFAGSPERGRHRSLRPSTRCTFVIEPFDTCRAVSRSAL